MKSVAYGLAWAIAAILCVKLHGVEKPAARNEGITNSAASNESKSVGVVYLHRDANQLFAAIRPSRSAIRDRLNRGYSPSLLTFLTSEDFSHLRVELELSRDQQEVLRQEMDDWAQNLERMGQSPVVHDVYLKAISSFNEMTLPFIKQTLLPFQLERLQQLDRRLSLVNFGLPILNRGVFAETLQLTDSQRGRLPNVQTSLQNAIEKNSRKLAEHTFQQACEQLLHDEQMTKLQELCGEDFGIEKEEFTDHVPTEAAHKNHVPVAYYNFGDVRDDARWMGLHGIESDTAFATSLMLHRHTPSRLTLLTSGWLIHLRSDLDLTEQQQNDLKELAIHATGKLLGSNRNEIPTLASMKEVNQRYEQEAAEGIGRILLKHQMMRLVEIDNRVNLLVLGLPALDQGEFRKSLKLDSSVTRQLKTKQMAMESILRRREELLLEYHVRQYCAKVLDAEQMTKLDDLTGSDWGNQSYSDLLQTGQLQQHEVHGR